ncbi:MAG TPA: phosphatase PAP2 family protein [Rubrobacteraceae bacterium]|nr:phosphatase PAP2 family protein [Rubrobacteraceae bacterium]
MFERLLDKHRGSFRKISERLSLTAALWLVAGLAVSTGVIALFAKITEDVAEGESRRFDRAVLLWIHATFPDWLNEPMRLVTTLGYYYVVIPLLAAAVLAFYLRGWKLSAVLLVVSTAGGIVLTTVLKTVFQRARPELFDSGYTASFFSFPSGHATVAVGFYGMLTLILAYHLRGLARWAVAAGGVLLVLTIGFSRLYLGVHYPTDVLAGFLASPLWVITVGAVYVLWLALRGRTARENVDRENVDREEQTEEGISGARKDT